MQESTHDTSTRAGCPVEQLSWLINHTLTPEERITVEAHLLGCPSCRHDVEEWSHMKLAMLLASEATPLPRADLFHSIEQQLEAATLRHRIQTLTRSLWHKFHILVEHGSMQLRLIRSDLFWMPLLLLPIAVSLAVWHHASQDPLSIQAFLAALMTALGMAFLYSHETDPAYEMLRVTQTAPSLVLLLRCGLVFGYDLLINLAGLLPFLLTHATITPAWFLANWLAPLCCLTAISLLLSILANSKVASAVCLILWGLRAISFIQPGTISPTLQYYETFWHQTPLLFFITVLAVFLTLILFERRELFSR